jgi:putative FmdB family regulatory protein
MPLYEYHCDDCQADVELLIRGTDQPVCPTCGGTRLAKQFSVPAAHVAGGKLPLASSNWEGCGRPGCGSGGCASGGAM